MQATPRLEASITVNKHPVKVIVEGPGARTPEQTLRDIADHVRRVEAEMRGEQPQEDEAEYGLYDTSSGNRKAKIATAGAAAIARALADHFAQSNPKFDRARFLAAAGVTQ